jgi:hypothetical protein
VISCFPGMLPRYFLNDFEMVPVTPIITGITFVFTLHKRCISIVRSLRFRKFSAYFLITFVIIIIIIMQFLSLMFFWALNLVHLPRTLLVFDFPLGISETFLCFMWVHPVQIVPPAGVPLRQIQFIINWMSSEGKLSHLVRCHIILLHYYKVSSLII